MNPIANQQQNTIPVQHNPDLAMVSKDDIDRSDIPHITGLKGQRFTDVGNRIEIDVFRVFQEKEAVHLFKKMQKWRWEHKVYYQRRLTQFARVPRGQLAFYTESDTPVNYNNCAVPTNTFINRETNRIIKRIHSKIKELTGETYNYTLLNYYVNGSDYISIHKDCETGFVKGQDRPVVIIAFYGETGILEPRGLRIDNKNRMQKSFYMHNGAAISLNKKTNSHVWHGVLKQPSFQHARISISLRNLVPGEEPEVIP